MMDSPKKLDLINGNNQNIDILIKSSILKLYFSNERFESINQTRVNITIKDIKVLKLLAMPKKIYRKYVLVAKENEKIYTINISHKEKRIIKEFIASMEYKCFTNQNLSNN